ncbi:hypothetical protein BFO01nite_14270 [Brevibacillus formosus]|uniref:Sporulation protein YjcZ n=1 Tax=Brevibacillus formosus TaxID=54913 RepID=A0ABQ0T226_9BACL|nr:hypothetical protein BFO01nite_14270 [Brevibacillus formosus]
MGGMEWCEECDKMKGGSDVRGFGFFNEEGFEVIIWIIVIVFLLVIFFDEGID